MRAFAIVMACGFCGPILCGAAWAQGGPHYAFDNAIPNIPGKSLRAVVVEYAPGAANKPHRHAPSAFVTAYVLEGAVRSQADDGPVRVYHAGEHFTEKPGAHHRVSENASKTEPARMLAIFVMDTADKRLSMPDP
jgi:quercetin dioxygenase-like cupin family protein